MGENIELRVAVESFEPLDARPPTASLDTARLVNPKWDDFTDVDREATLCLVRDGLADLLSRVEEWVPRSFKMESNNRLDVTISFDLVDIDNYVALRQLDQARHLAEMQKQLLRMKATFDD